MAEYTGSDKDVRLFSRSGRQDAREHPYVPFGPREQRQPWVWDECGTAGESDSDERLPPRRCAAVVGGWAGIDVVATSNLGH